MRRYRKDRDISQDALARKVGVTTSAISQIERAINKPRRETADDIDKALDAGGTILVAFGYTDPVVSQSSSTDTDARFGSVDERLRKIEEKVNQIDDAAGRLCDLAVRLIAQLDALLVLEPPAQTDTPPAPDRPARSNHPGR